MCEIFYHIKCDGAGKSRELAPPDLEYFGKKIKQKKLECNNYFTHPLGCHEITKLQCNSFDSFVLREGV